MARRPKRSFTDELTQHAALACGARDITAALAVLQPDVPEFGVAARLLADGHALLRVILAAHTGKTKTEAVA